MKTSTKLLTAGALGGALALSSGCAQIAQKAGGALNSACAGRDNNALCTGAEKVGAAYNTATTAASAAASRATTFVLDKMDASSAEAWQGALNDRNCGPIAVDGQPGDGTKTAHAALEIANGSVTIPQTAKGVKAAQHNCG